MQTLQKIFKKALAKQKITQTEGEFLINTPDERLEDLLSLAVKIREKHCGNKAYLCAIINAKSGNCSEDCVYCAQSVHHQTNSAVYSLVTPEKMLAAQEEARKLGVHCFSIVTAGHSMEKPDELTTIKKILKDFDGVTAAASLGILSKNTLTELKNAGLKKYHHNLETARSFFDRICTTHNYEERVATIERAKEAGLKICCGGIFGLGETAAQRIELALELARLEVESVPINILHPIPGTKIFGQVQPLRWQDILKLIAAFRFILPDKTLILAGGREKNLGVHQDKIFAAGGNGLLVGNYLTTGGRSVADDLAMIKASGLEPVRE